ncbi:pyrroline-5-carboxylate reductase [Ruminococcaceae bacterium OttesenSCG-928-O06]|nr:pyrroline-5-carboxylate reductase [Ruminococcaceae bacterium OttesenSCG-928-O06]
MPKKLEETRLGFVGAGQMCEAILAGALAAGAILPKNVTITDIAPARLEHMAKTYGVHTLPNSAKGEGTAAVAAGCEVVLLCLKPQLAAEALRQSAAAFGEGTLIISIMGGVTLATLAALLPQSPIIRVMPNTPMLVGAGTAGIAPGDTATNAHVALCCALFDAVGHSHILPEKLIDPLTAVSGCGPAFACLFMEALADGGVEQGLPRTLALQLAAEMLEGTARMVLQTGQSPAALKDAVCSPGGGTIAGVHALEDGAFRASVLNAVQKAAARMEELGHSAS